MSTNDPILPRPVAMENITIEMPNVSREGDLAPVRNNGTAFNLDPNSSTYVELLVGTRRYSIDAVAYPDAGTHLTQIRYKNEANGLNDETGVQAAVALVLLRQANAIANGSNVTPSAISRYQATFADALDNGLLDRSVNSTNGTSR
jgi:hypothetical protein